MSDLKNAIRAIQQKRPILDTLFSYANGPQPLKYSTERLREAFDNITARFEINWCSVIVNATNDRLRLTGFDTPDETANAILEQVFDNAHVDIEAGRTHYAALAATSGYVIAWSDGAEVEVYYNDPRLCHVFYSSEKPRMKTYAAKWFELDDGRQEVTLYYPDRLEHYRTMKPVSGEIKAESFMLESTDPNPFGEIPVFEFISPGETAQVLTMQDAVNKLFSDMMVAAEFGAFVQRWVISQSDPGQLKNGPNMIWWLPAGDESGQSTSTGQFTPTALSGYLDAMDKIAHGMAIISRTPKNYLMTTGADVSGEALVAMESPLIKKVEQRQMVFSSTWQDVAQFILRMSGIEMDESEISVVWSSPESVQPKTEAEIRQLAINSGIPLETQLRREGWTQAELDAMAEDAQMSKSGMAGDIGNTLVNALRQLDQTNPADESENVA